LRRACRYGTPLSLLLFDLDHFKRVNDTYGHPQGDEVLRAFAHVLDGHSRQRVDRVARLGGEEFAALLPQADVEGTHAFAEKVRHATEEMHIAHATIDGTNNNHSPIHVTVSVGAVVATPPLDCTIPMPDIATYLFHLADQCLYRAKAAGRNRSVIEVTSDLEPARTL
jgi:diguanylate cyclase (GGDEF)-like protein